jgi:hypothetical protein
MKKIIVILIIIYYITQSIPSVLALTAKDATIEKNIKKIEYNLNTFDKTIYAYSQQKNREKRLIKVRNNINRLLSSAKAHCPNTDFNIFRTQLVDLNCLKVITYQ